MPTLLRFAAIAALLLALLGCAAGADSRPRWSKAADVDVAAFSTFGWADRSGKPPVTILDNRIRDAIRAQLTAKGYVESPDAPDFLVHHETVEQETVRQGSPVRIGIGVGTRGGNVGGSVGTSVGVGEANRVQEQIRVTIRALHGDDRREAWVGTTAAMDARPEQRAVERVVSGVMKGFPAKQD